MTQPARFQDFARLPAERRPAELKRCVERTRTIGRDLHAVVETCDGTGGEGRLAFWPYAAKDLFDNGSRAPSWGCAVSPRAVAPIAPVLASLDRAGACRIAYTEMTELAYEPSGHNHGRGRALNPWSKAIASGGSSSGSAVLVASGCCAFALGSDTGGSVRIPAQCCGITALKPTWGGIATEGAMALAPSLDTIGLMARSAVDIAEVWPAVTLRSGEASAIRSAAVLTDAFAAADSQVARACREAAAEFSALGLSVSDAGGFPEDADAQALIVMQAEAARVHRDRFADERIDPVLRKRLSKGLGIGDAELAAALARRSTLLEAFLGQLGGADVALLPVMPIVTPEVAEVDPSSPRFSGKTLYAMSRFTRFANYLGLPVLAVPAGFDDRGMPLALQIVGRPGSEASLIALGVAFQSRTAWHGIVPADIRSDIAAEEGSYQ